MRAELLHDVEAWRREAEPLLVIHEARNNLILGVADTLRRIPVRYPGASMWLVRSGTHTSAAALRTPPYNLLVGGPIQQAAIEVLLDAVVASGDSPPGVTASLPEAHRIADAWCGRRGGAWKTEVAQGIYSLERVAPIAATPGSARPAADADRDLLLDWVRGFSEEALWHRPLSDDQIAASVDDRLGGDGGGFSIWEDESAPVSICGFGGTTPSGIRIGPVYTPPAFRGRGYATALVAKVSSDRLAEGRRACYLYTDLANPTSNAIYRRIGYERVCDSVEIRFTP